MPVIGETLDETPPADGSTFASAEAFDGGARQTFTRDAGGSFVRTVHDAERRRGAEFDGRHEACASVSRHYSR